MGTTRATGRKLTYDDFLLFPDDGRRHELIDGEHYVTPSPFIRHQELLKRLAFAIESHLRAHPGQGQMFFAPLDCVLTNHDVVEPDLFVVTEDQKGILTDRHVQGVPALVVEILSKGSRRLDGRLKRDVYDRVGYGHSGSSIPLRAQSPCTGLAGPADCWSRRRSACTTR